MGLASKLREAYFLASPDLGGVALRGAAGATFGAGAGSMYDERTGSDDGALAGALFGGAAYGAPGAAAAVKKFIRALAYEIKRTNPKVPDAVAYAKAQRIAHMKATGDFDGSV